MLDTMASTAYGQQRAREQQAAAHRRASAARAALPAVVDALVHRHGARRVLLVGSLADAGSSPPSDIEIHGAGALLHGYYNTLEPLLARIATDLNAGPPEGGDWHRRLLRSMALDKPGHRPPVLDEETLSELDRYLGFRHLFRHLYVLDLGWPEVRLLLDGLAEVHRDVDEQLSRFDAFLEGLAGE